MLRCHIWVLLGVKRLFSLSLSFSLFLACSKPIFGPLQTGTSILVLVSATWRWRRFLKWVACTTLGVAVPFFVVSYLFPSTTFFVGFRLMFFGFGLISYVIFFPYTSFVHLSLPVLCLLHVSFSCFSFRYFTIISVCFLSKRQVSKCTQSLALFYSFD